mgnify:CR=1 FL=1
MTTSIQQIVASARGGRMTKWKGRVASAAPFMLFATVSVTALSTGMAHAETISTPINGPEVLAVGEDHEITATGIVTLTSSSEAAVEIDGDYGNTFTNNGAILVTGSSIETATGLLVNGSLLAGGQIVNNGTITMEHIYTDSVESYGIFVDGSVDGSITNAGTITLDHDDDVELNEGEFVGYGIYAGSLGVTGSIDNSGTITVRGVASETVSGYGIYVGDDAQGAIVNSGTIDIDVTSTDYYAYAYGIYVVGDLTADGSILNSGTISATAITTSESTAYAYGISVNGDAFGNVTNTGTIEVLASAQDTYNGYAYGIEIEGELGATLSNSGTIDVTANAITDPAQAYGIAIRDDVTATGSISNTGTIDVNASVETDSEVEAYGIYVGGDLLAESSVSNTGTIDVYAENETSEAYAYGIYVEGAVEAGASLSNSGTVMVEAFASSDEDAVAVGILVEDDVSGSLANSGTIMVDANASYSVDA